jgi:hypothetical protein
VFLAGGRAEVTPALFFRLKPKLPSPALLSPPRPVEGGGIAEPHTENSVSPGWSWLPFSTQKPQSPQEAHRAYYSQLSVGHRAARGMREENVHEQESPCTRSDSCSHAFPSPQRQPSAGARPDDLLGSDVSSTSCEKRSQEDDPVTCLKVRGF